MRMNFGGNFSVFSSPQKVKRSSGLGVVSPSADFLGSRGEVFFQLGGDIFACFTYYLLWISYARNSARTAFIIRAAVL
jgi:hypothetical protein